MTETLLKFCGLTVEGASRVAGAEFALRNKEWLGWIIGTGIVLALLTWFSYRRDASEMMTHWRRRVLTALRMLLLGLLALLLLRPVVAFTIESADRKSVV